MRAYVGVTDFDWFKHLRSIPDLEEANFWQPSGARGFRALIPGELFLFKLHSPLNFIVGGGVFTHFTPLPVATAWETFGEKNGARSFFEMRDRVVKYRRTDKTDFAVGCIILTGLFFLPEDQWIPIPPDWSMNIVQGRTYDLTAGHGKEIYRRLHQSKAIHIAAATAAGYGAPTLIQPRLGQGSFRVMVTDAYQRRCALTSERTLPALEAAHIRPYSEVQKHDVTNGLLMRRDLHALFDRGYITVTPKYKIEVSKRIKEEFENGKDYYRLHGEEIRMPGNKIYLPSEANLRWHNDQKFLA
jgi:putative restriction endonuclease